MNWREKRERETERVEQEEAEPDGMISGSRIRGEEEGPDKSKSGVNRPWRGKNGGEGEGEGFAIVGRGTFGKVGTWEGMRSGHRKKKCSKIVCNENQKCPRSDWRWVPPRGPTAMETVSPVICSEQQNLKELKKGPK